MLQRYLSTIALLLAASLAGPARAQTTAPPAWAAAAVVGSGSNIVGYSTVDGAGNTYEIRGFDNTVSVGTSTLTSLGNTDVYLAKYAPTGQVLWVRQLGSAGPESGQAVAVDAAGNVYVTGSFNGTISLGNNLSLTGSATSGSRRLFVVRYSPQGTAEWAQQSANSGTGSGLGFDAAGTLYLTGLFSSSLTLGTTTLTTSRYANFLARFASASGTLLAFDKVLEYGPATGTTPSYSYPSLVVAPGGQTYLLNRAIQPIVLDGTTYASRGGYDIVVARYSPQGAFEWAQQLGGAGDDIPYGGAVDALGNFYLSGAFTGPAQLGAFTAAGFGDYDAFLTRYSSLGTQQWLQTAGGPGPDFYGNLALDAQSNVYLASNFSNTAQFGSQTLTSAGSRDALVAAYSPQGQLRWLQQAGGPDTDVTSNLGFDASGRLLVLGRFAATCTFGPFSLSTTAPSGATFLARLDNVLATRPARAAQPLAFYPSPAHDQLHLPALPAGTPVQLLDALGRVARAARVTAGQVSVRGLPAGLYTLRALDAQGRPCTGRVVVE
ncbi:SBBP repeat-containing protein [Hymenobacter jeollabukensis]|uniref:T9SS type A sorting domain-containing protein n=1 Tax=Hymenobacter jeollabukensis TaxID=2025313 RepID=A0A5R8WNS7_9BACT|nr:SBBP repeat-containing protein [Hymenobacter jeollabukensis]TLM91081.1 hypothetical protein FDY95_15910 [Hymenobacter jeollabukensis]